jgi:hypothetical protein
MSDDTGAPGGGAAPQATGDQTAHKIGEQILDMLRSSRVLPVPTGRMAATPSEIGRIMQAFLKIEDARVRSEFVSLIEAVGVTQTR